MKHIIVTGGIAAGKTNLINRIIGSGNWVVGSPATTMKRKLARMIARTVNTDGSEYGWEHYFEEMLDRRAKEKYRGILQGYGEHFSNIDNFFWVRLMMNEVQQQVADRPWRDRELQGITGTVYDSVRRPQEIIGIRQVYPDAVRVHLAIYPERQINYLCGVLGYEESRAVATLAHSSEHWLDEADAVHDNITGAELVIDANKGDDYIWQQFKDVILA